MSKIIKPKELARDADLGIYHLSASLAKASFGLYRVCARLRVAFHDGDRERTFHPMVTLFSTKSKPAELARLYPKIYALYTIGADSEEIIMLGFPKSDDVPKLVRGKPFIIPAIDAGIPKGLVFDIESVQISATLDFVAHPITPEAFIDRITARHEDELSHAESIGQ